MAGRDNDNLENFFLKRVKDYQIEYREEDWQKLSELLDASEAMKAAVLRQRIIWVGFGVLLALCVALLIWMSQNMNGLSQNDSPDNPTETTVAGSIIDDSETARLQSAPLEEPEDVDASIPVSASMNNQPQIEEKGEGNSSGNGELVEEEQVNDEIIPRGGDNPGSEPGQVDQLILENEPESIPVHSLTEEEVNPATPILLSRRNPGILRESLNSTNLLFTALENKDQLEFKRNYSWNFSVAADYSAVGVTEFDGPALRAGISFEYYILRNLSILAGLNYSEKEYSAYGREYTPPYGYWTRGIVPDETYGECSVLDIPINLTYYIPNARGQSFFLRAGLSSWLMLEEHYYYEYDNNNDPDLVSYWGGENENYHYFSVVNLSAGFEHPLSTKVSVLAEPYFNIPLAGVGFGAVDLHSTGLKLTMKINHYKLITNK
jgi:hypothetical protein